MPGVKHCPENICLPNSPHHQATNHPGTTPYMQLVLPRRIICRNVCSYSKSLLFLKVRVRSTTTRDRNLHFGETSPLDSSIFQRICILFLQVCGCHGFSPPRTSIWYTVCEGLIPQTCPSRNLYTYMFCLRYTQES